MTDVPTQCRNCGTPLSGQYCSRCGQREGRPDLRFSDLAGEVVGEFIHWDSRVWRTLLALLFRPGHLTAEFIVGRRASYLPPVRLYLVISFIMFLLVSIGAQDSAGDIVFTDEDITQQAQEVDPAAAAGSDIGTTINEGGNNRLKVAVDPETQATMGANIDFADEDSPQWLQDLEVRMEANAARLEEDSTDFMELLAESLPQMMFLLLPVFALLTRLVYAFSPFHYLQHLVFALHYHSFAYLLYLVAAVVERFTSHLDGVLFLALLVYLPLALRRCYGSGVAGAIGKSLVVYVVYGVLLVLSFAFLALLALALM